MPNDFSGELSKARLFDLVRPLLQGKRSGMLLIKGHDTGELHIEAGAIIHATTGFLSGAEALFVMMEWESGRVTFDWEAIPEERTINLPTEELVLSWASREDEWQRIRELVPSSNCVFRIRADSGAEDRNIQGEQWKLLAYCNGIRSVSEIAYAVKWDLFKVSKIIYRMVQVGFLEKASEKAAEQKQPKRNANGNLFPVLEEELRRIMGPIAPVILEDKIAEFGESRDAFPEDRVQLFVQAIGEEIADNGKRALFTKIMKEFLVQRQH